MTRDALLCALTAHHEKHFIIKSDEVRALVERYQASSLLDDVTLFSKAYLRLVRDGFSVHETLQRLTSVYGVERCAHLLRELFGRNQA